MIAGKDYIGVGVGAMVFNGEDQIFLSQRGPTATNERGHWEFPGGKVTFGETLQETIIREFMEEYGMEIAIVELVGVSDHILAQEHQHWVSPTYIARHIGGDPRIREPEKCTAIGWFTLGHLPQPLSQVTRDDLRAYTAKYGTHAPWR